MNHLILEVEEKKLLLSKQMQSQAKSWKTKTNQ